MMWPLMWLNRSVAIINATLQFLDTYRLVQNFGIHERDKRIIEKLIASQLVKSQIKTSYRN